MAESDAVSTETADQLHARVLAAIEDEGGCNFQDGARSIANRHAPQIGPDRRGPDGKPYTPAPTCEHCVAEEDPNWPGALPAPWPCDDFRDIAATIGIEIPRMTAPTPEQAPAPRRRAGVFDRAPAAESARLRCIQCGVFLDSAPQRPCPVCNPGGIKTGQP